MKKNQFPFLEIFPANIMERLTKLTNVMVITRIFLHQQY